MLSDVDKAELSSLVMCLAQTFRYTQRDYRLIADVAKELALDPINIKSEERAYLEDQNEADWRVICECCSQA